MGRIKELLAANKVVKTFQIGRIIHPVMLDLFGLSGGGFDAFWMDQEHGGLTYQQIVHLGVAARANGFDTFVRMAPSGYELVTQNLEAGANGVLAAQIFSAEQAEQFVRWAKFAPRGSRGMNTGGRDANFTLKKPAEFAVDANRDHLVGIQIETLPALEQVEQIAAIDGVELLFIGPTDLSLSMGLVGQMMHPTVWEGIERVAAACRRHGKHWGTIAVDPTFADKALERGCRMLTFCSDTLAVRRGLEATRAMFAKQWQ
jgi:4-hydroxy-2-oxoheptanedioate aldolase